MAENKRQPNRSKKGEPTARSGKISFYGFSIEDALLAAARTGRPPPLAAQPEAATEQMDEIGLKERAGRRCAPLAPICRLAPAREGGGFRYKRVQASPP